MHVLDVSLDARSYPILIGSGLLQDKSLLCAHIPNRQVLIVSNTTVAPLYLERIRSALCEAGRQVVVHLLPDGEQYKDQAHVDGIYTTLLENRFGRDCVLVALGGGVVGDMTGYAAACYQRGVAFVQIPTTLLSQVDSSVGGKTGINHPLGKNMIGAFKQPRAVIADIATLDTLPDREFSAGMAEVIKYGLIRDTAFLAWLRENMADLMKRGHALVAEAVRRSCSHKAEVVAADEFEHDQRALLNLGHTFGHAIETAMGYGAWLHGEAVAAGTMMAADLSSRLGWIGLADVNEVRTLLLAASLPVQAPVGMTPEDFMTHMAVDKKVKDGQIRLILLRDLGEAVVTADYDRAALAATLAAFTSTDDRHAL